jgi:hydrogenase nickel incorporation protein HypB
MCGVCGCGSGQKTVDGKALDEHEHHHAHEHSPDHEHRHDHEHSHDHDHGHHHHHHDHAHAPGLDGARMVQIEMDIMSKNDGYAAQNRARFAASGQLALNLVSSPGSGKTSLLVRTLEDLKDEMALGVIEGDQQTANDADRIRATGVPAVQLNTGKGCHLDAHMVGHALDDLPLDDGGVLFIENVGNLVCPAGFDLGEAHKVVVLSVTEGEDKPLKYPDMFAAADLMLLNKIDLLPHLDFEVDAAIANARQINPSIRVLQVSARSGQGMEDWYAFLRAASTLAGIGRHRPAVQAAE